MRHTQLDLFSGTHELYRLLVDNAALQAACEALQAENEVLTDTTRTLTAERDAARREVNDLRLQVRTAHYVLELQRTQRRGTPAALPAWLSQELRHLLTICHPDKWNQGQPATELAHEVAVLVNQWRQEVQA